MMRWEHSKHKIHHSDRKSISKAILIALFVLGVLRTRVWNRSTTRHGSKASSRKIVSKALILLAFGLCVSGVLRAAQDDEPYGSLGIESNPQDVAIWLDGDLMGFRTPFLIEKATPGIHKLILSKPGHRTWRDTVRIRLDELTSVTAFLDSIEYEMDCFVVHDLPGFYDLDHESINLDLSAYRTSRVASWELSILDMYGNTFRTLKGKRSPPGEVAWDGKAQDSTKVLTVGDVYTFIFKLYMKRGSVMSRVGEEIEIKGIASGNRVVIKESEMDYVGMIPPPAVTRYYDYVIERFETKGYSRITIIAPTFERGQPINQYLAVNLPYARLNMIQDPSVNRVEFIMD